MTLRMYQAVKATQSCIRRIPVLVNLFTDQKWKDEFRKAQEDIHDALCEFEDKQLEDAARLKKDHLVPSEDFERLVELVQDIAAHRSDRDYKLMGLAIGEAHELAEKYK